MIESFHVRKSEFSDIFLPHLESYDKRINVYYGGAGSGKSYFVVQKLIFKFMKDPGRKGLVIRKVQGGLRDSTFALFINILSKWKLLPFCHVVKSRLEIELPNGSIFIFKGLDDSEKIKSIDDISDIIIEEATELIASDFNQLDIRLRSDRPNNQIHLMFNPISKANWVYSRWFHEESVIDDDTFVIHTTYKDNRFLPEANKKTLENLKLNNYSEYVINALGEFATLDKLIYSNVSIEDFNYNEVIKSNPNIEAYFGLDFGMATDPTAFVATLLDKENKKIYIYDEFYERGLLSNEIANEIIKKGYRKERILADHDIRTIAEIKREGVERIKTAKKGGYSILAGIQYIKQHEIIVHPKCINAIDEFKNYTWVKNREGEYINKAVDTKNHLMDALRYALSETHSSGKIKILDRRKLGI